MRKTVKKKVLISAITLGALVITVPTAVHAKTHNFNYKMYTAVNGKTRFSLEKKSTKVTTTANTYHASNNKVTSPKLSYKVALTSIGLVRYKNVGAANGTKKTINYGTINKGTYRVNLCVGSDNFGYSRYVKGSGQIVQ